MEGHLRLHPLDPSTKVTRAVWSIRLRALQGRIHTALYSDTRRGKSSEIEQQESIVHLRQEIECWRESVPNLSPPTGPALSLFMTDDWSNLVYNQAILQLYRPQLTTGADDDHASDILMTSASVASEVCAAFRRQFFGKATTYTWGALHELFLAGLTFLYCVRRSSNVRSRLGYERISKACTDCTIAFVILAERWRDAAPYRDLFEALSSSTLSFVSQGRSTVTASAGNPAFEVPNSQAESSLMGEPDFSTMFAAFSEEVSAPAQVDTLLDALLVDWT